MELGRPSNVGSLIAAVLVAVLALVSGRYARLGAHWFHAMSAAQEMATTDSLRTSHVSASDTESADAISNSTAESLTTADAVGAKVDQLEGQLTQILEQRRTARGSDRALANRAKKLLQEVAQVRDRLRSDDALQQSLTTVGRLSLLRVYFLAAQLSPHEYTVEFEAFSQQLIKSTEANERTQAAALRIYLRHDLNHPNLTELITSIEEFARENPDTALTVELWSLISQELWLRGHHTVARGLLQRGIQFHTGQPAVSRLVNQLIDQQQPVRTR